MNRVGRTVWKQSPCIRMNTIRWTRSQTTGPIHVSSGQAKLFYFNRLVTSHGRFEYNGNRRLRTRYFPIINYKKNIPARAKRTKTLEKYIYHENTQKNDKITVLLVFARNRITAFFLTVPKTH